MKKFISLILAIVLVVSSVSVFAREYYDGYDFMDSIFKFDVVDLLAGEGNIDVEDELDEETKIMMLLETLGLWDDASISKNELVTMHEFSKLLSTLKLGTENAFISVYDLNPTEEYATYNHAYTYLVETLGYSYLCKQYPNAKDANIIVAAEIGLLKEKPENINSYITRGELAWLIYKAMNMDLCVIEYPLDGGYRHTIVEGKTLLNSVHSIFLMNGLISGIPGLNVYGTDKVRDGYIHIDGREIKDSGMDLTKYFGCRVQAYTKYDDYLDEYSLIAVDFDEDTEIFEVDFRNISYINSYEIGYLDENGEEDTYNVSNLNYVIENGEILNSITDICDYNENEGVIRFTASTSSGVIDTAIIYKYNYYVVNNIDTRLFRIVLRYNRTHNGNPYIQLDDKAPIDVYIDGIKSEYSNLVSGSVIKVFQCPSTGYVRIDAMSQNVIVGEPEILDENMVTVDGEEYRLAKDWEIFVDKNKDNTEFISQQRPKELQLGVNTTFYVIDGIIAAYTSSQSYKYGYIKSVSKDRTAIDPDLTFRIFDQDGEWNDYKITKNIEFEGEANISKETILEAINSDARVADFFDHPIRFRANGDMELLALDTIYESMYEIESDEDIVFTQNLAMVRDWTYENLGRTIPYFMSENTVILVAPGGSTDEDDFRSISNTQMPAGTLENPIPTKIYNINEYRQVNLLLMTSKMDASGGTTTYFYVQKITDVVIDADNQIYGKKISGKELKSAGRANGFVRDAYFYVEENAMDKNDGESYDPNSVLEKGDFIKASVSGTDLVSWEMELKGGKVPAVSEKAETVSNAYRASGKFVRADAASGVWVVDVNGVQWPSIPTVKAIIKPDTYELIVATESDFIEGEDVCYDATYGRGNYFIKNEY